MEDTTGIKNDDVRRIGMVAPNNAVAASLSTKTATETSTNPFLLAERTGTDAKYRSRIFLESRPNNVNKFRMDLLNEAVYSGERDQLFGDHGRLWISENNFDSARIIFACGRIQTNTSENGVPMQFI
jgi:hypothetical protein